MRKFALIKTVTWNLVLITGSSILCTVAINGILIPQQFISGGFTGLAMLIHYLVPFFSVGVVYFILNIPNAFVVISDTLEVMGQRIGNQPHW
jgi:uncharacterized membrane-anchored protein YitT (DUF2179 family)